MDSDRGGVGMESLTEQGLAIAGADSLPRFSKGGTNFSVVADTKTSAASCCSYTGQRFRVSFGFVPPPEISSFCYGWEDPQVDGDYYPRDDPNVVAAHGDCVLIEVKPKPPSPTPSPCGQCWSRPWRPLPPPEYFLYQAAAAGPGPPRLLLLPPPCYTPCKYSTCLLQRSEDEILVAQLEVTTTQEQDQDVAELCVLCLGRDSEWQYKRVPIVGYDDYRQGSSDDDSHGDVDERRQRLRWRCWCTDAAFAVGDRFLCWVDYLRGCLFSDMTADEASLRLRYVALPLPAVPRCRKQYSSKFWRPNMAWTWNLAAAGHASVRFVDVESRWCCSDDPGSSRCEHGRCLFTVTTWTMSLSMDDEAPMEWVKDGVLDCDELWANPGYKDLPRTTVECPIVVNSDDPDAVRFVVRTTDDDVDKDCADDRKAWAIEVDMRSKMLRSVVPYNDSSDDEGPHPIQYFPANIQHKNLTRYQLSRATKEDPSLRLISDL